MSINIRTLSFLLTAYVHLWDSLLVQEETQRMLYRSDLFGQPVDGLPTAGCDLSDRMVESLRQGGLMPSMRHVQSALDELEHLLNGQFGLKTVACHHGSVLTEDLKPYFKPLRENDVTAAVLG